MAQQNTGEKVPLTIYLSADVARRLQLAAETRKRAAADAAAELLDRYLPRPQTGESKKGSIPYA